MFNLFLLIRARIRAAEQHIKARSAAAESSWNSSDSSGQTGLYGVVGKILSVLEELDKYVFDKLDPNTNCIDVLAAKIWGPCQPGQAVSSQVKKIVLIAQNSLFKKCFC